MLNRTYSRRSFFRLLALSGGVASLAGGAAIHQAVSASHSSPTQVKSTAYAHVPQKVWAERD